MDPKQPASEQQKKLPPQVEQMLASAKEMEGILTKKLSKIDAVSQEKSEMAKQEATKIKLDVEEIKRLSLVQTKEGEEALKAKIMEVNQRIEATTRKAAELQLEMIALQQELYTELRKQVIIAQKMVQSLEEIPADERTKFIASTNYMVVHAGRRLSDMQEYVRKLETMQHKMDLVESVQKMSKEDAVKMLEDQVNIYLGPSREPTPSQKGGSVEPPARPMSPLPKPPNEKSTDSVKDTSTEPK